jgi:phosphopantothenoylcysteine decarboxylase/phosphopantothenate--cysteine ligase
MSVLILGVSGSVSVYKACDLASKLVQAGHSVRTVMTHSAAELVSPQLFEALTGEAPFVDEFSEERQGGMDHIEAARGAELFLVAPMTGNLAARLALGLADDLVSTVSLAVAAGIPRLACPAMNPSMLGHPAVKRNLKTLAEDGWEVMEPGSGNMACGDEGSGRLPEPSEILAKVEELLGR